MSRTWRETFNGSDGTRIVQEQYNRWGIQTRKKYEIYKYDDIINKKLASLKKNNNNFQISNFNSNRKIPNKEELKKKYDNFLKKIQNIQIEEKKLCVSSFGFSLLYFF